MSHSKLNISLCILSMALLIQIAIGEKPIFKICSTTSKKFTSRSAYEKNLNELFTDFKLTIPKRGSSLGSAGKFPNKVFGLSQCRGNAPITNCRNCLSQARNDIRKLCPNNKAAMIWYNDCFLRYSNSEFFGKVNTRYGAILQNSVDAKDPVSFSKGVTTFLKKLSLEASQSSKLFAAGKRKIGGSDQIFGSVDCTVDLSSSNCKLCIDAIVDALRDVKLGAKIGGQIISASCNIRFETFAF